MIVRVSVQRLSLSTRELLVDGGALEMKPRLIFLLIVILFAAAGNGPVAAQQHEPRIALIIGNGAYTETEAPLKDSVNSARALADELRRLGFDVDVGENLTSEGMRSAFDRFYGKIKSGSTALLFFSGYAIQSDRETYMIPRGAQIWTESDVRRDGYNLNSVLAEMNTRGARVKIAILDASRRNPFEARFRAVAGGLAPISAPRDTVVMYAAAPGAVAKDGSDPTVFVKELIKQIRIPGTIEEVFSRTRIAVARASHNEQVPWISSSLTENFFVTSSGSAAPVPADAAKRAEAQLTELARPAPSPPRLDPFEQLRLTTEQYLKSVPARYNVPDYLTYGRSKEISFVLEPQGVGTAADRLTGMPGDVVTTTVQVSPHVKALLTGPSDLVEIRLRGGDDAQRKAVTLSAPVQWIWDVKAVGVGTAKLQLDLISFIPNTDKDTFYEARSFSREIPIEISMIDRAARVVAEINPLWGFLAAVITALGGTLAFFGWKPAFGRSRKKDES